MNMNIYYYVYIYIYIYIYINIYMSNYRCLIYDDISSIREGCCHLLCLIRQHRYVINQCVYCLAAPNTDMDMCVCVCACVCTCVYVCVCMYVIHTHNVVQYDFFYSAWFLHLLSERENTCI